MGSRGPIACDRCGGRIEQPATGRRRRYCGRTCRELAYRVRKTDRAVSDALEAAGVDPHPVSSVVERSIPVTSVVESGPDLVPSVDERRKRPVINAPLGMLWGIQVPYDD